MKTLFALIWACLSFVTGCQSLSWQREISGNGFVPLPDVAILRLVEHDPDKPGTGTLLNKKVLAGTMRVLNPQDFEERDGVWTWKDIPQLTELNLPLDLVGGAEKYIRSQGMKIGLKAKPRTIGDFFDVEVDLSQSLELANVWLLRVSAPEEKDVFHAFLREFVLDLRDPEKRKFMLLTNVLVTDLDEQKNAGLKIKGPISSEQFPVNVDLGANRKVQLKGRGVALGVQGLIIERTRQGFRVADDVAPAVPIPSGHTSYDMGPDKVFVQNTPQGLRFQWVGIVDAALYVREDRGWVRRDGVIPPESRFSAVMLWDWKTEGGKILALQISWEGNSPSIQAGAAYTLSRKDLHYTSLASEVSGKSAPVAIDLKSWESALGPGVPMNVFRELLLDTLRPIEPAPNEAPISRYNIVEVFAPVPGDPSHYDRVRMTQYDVRNQSGKLFRFQAYRRGAVGVARAHVFGQRRDGTLEDLTSSRIWYTDVPQSITIPRGIDYLYVRSASRHELEKGMADFVGFHGGRYFPVTELNWTVAFLPPLGESCRLVLGESAPDAPVLPDRARGELPDWALKILQLKAERAEVEVKTVQDRMHETFKICSFPRLRVGSKVAWVVHSTGQ